MILRICLMVGTVLAAVHGQDLPTTYQYFTQGGIRSGLEATKEGFKVNGKPLKIVSGAIHYFRVHPDLWRDRLRKLRAMGANTVETYVPWNLHEPQRDVYDFGNQWNDFSAFLNITRYIQMAQEEDLMVLLRPGPFICAEWEFGGFPSWLQQDPNMRVRESYQPYLDRVEKYWWQLLYPLVDLQFTRGGPIIGLQIENEYGVFYPRDKEYLQFLADLVKKIGLTDTLLFTSDNAKHGDTGAVLGTAVHTLNFNTNPEYEFDTLRAMQPDKPLMAMEYWGGWYDHWFESHTTTPLSRFESVLDTIIGPKYNGSVNFYMFHGGTNFGFMSGANAGDDAPGIFFAVTSYDYDSPLSEAGDYTAKYWKAMELIAKYAYPKLARPETPPQSTKRSYTALRPTEYIPYEGILARVPDYNRFWFENPTAMEDLDMNGGSGQSYGYIVHRKTTWARSGSVVSAGPVQDFGLVLVDGKIQEDSFADASGVGRFWINSAKNVTLQGISDGEHNIDILVEHLGRKNVGWQPDFKQKKGMPNGYVTIDGWPVSERWFEVFALEFKYWWVRSLSGFYTTQDMATVQAPLIAKATLWVTEVGDTFIDMTGWTKGIVFINDFNLGRYWNVGPQQTLYVPSPLLKVGENTIIVFELLGAGSEIRFVDTPNLG